MMWGSRNSCRQHGGTGCAVGRLVPTCLAHVMRLGQAAMLTPGEHLRRSMIFAVLNCCPTNQVMQMNHTTNSSSSSPISRYDALRSTHHLCSCLWGMHNLNLIMRKHQSNPREWHSIKKRERESSIVQIACQCYKRQRRAVDVFQIKETKKTCQLNDPSWDPVLKGEIAHVVVQTID